MKSAKTSVISPQMAMDAVRKHLNKLHNAVNGVQYQAQLYETEMVDLLADFARKEDLPVPLRMQAAVHVITYARGTPRPWIHDSETIDPNAPGSSGNVTVGQELEEARKTERLQLQLSGLIAGNIHPSQWPEEIRSVAKDMVDYYESEESVQSPTGIGPKGPTQ